MKRSVILLVCIFLVGCATTPNLWGAVPLPSFPDTATLPPTPTATLTFTPSPTATLTLTITPTATLTLTPGPTETSRAIERVLIISFDGMRPDAIDAAGMTTVQSLREQGAYTLTAHTISYAVTLPAHASMLSGMCLDKHGVDWNAELYFRGYSEGTDIFDLTTAAGMRSLMIVGKGKFRQLAQPETTTVFLNRWVESRIGPAAIGLLPFGFDLMFLHFPSPDVMGHKHGWMTEAQFTALREGDFRLGELLAALDEYDLREGTLIIVTADHGGHDKTHTGTLREDVEIPWIMVGPGVEPMELTTQVQIMDTAATAAYALGLPIPEEWDGVPVYEAFGLPIGERADVVCP